MPEVILPALALSPEYMKSRVPPIALPVPVLYATDHFSASSVSASLPEAGALIPSTEKTNFLAIPSAKVIFISVPSPKTGDF